MSAREDARAPNARHKKENFQLISRFQQARTFVIQKAVLPLRTVADNRERLNPIDCSSFKANLD